MEIYLVRHTEVDIEEGICYGASDINLLDNHLNDFERIKKLILFIDKAIIYTSPLKRCLELAKTITEEYIIDVRLKEMDFGDWELKNWSDIPQKDFEHWMKDLVNHKCPNGESFVEIYTRTKDFWETVLEKNHDRSVIICHKGIIYSILAFLLKIPLENVFRIGIDYGSVTKISIDRELIKINYINKL